MRKKLKILLILLGSLLFFIFSGNLQKANAQDYERIDIFGLHVDVNTDGTIDVIETIHYDFGPQQKHGILREVPYQKTNQDGKKYNMKIEVKAVTDLRREPYLYTTSESNGKLNLKIGDPNNYATGKKVYQIEYKVYGALTYFTDHDELYWNATGDEWDIPVEFAEVTIKLPKDISGNVTINCYTGYKGSTASNCSTKLVANNLVTTQTKYPLYSREGLTFAVGFPKGYVTVLEPERNYNDLVLIFLFICFAILWFIWGFIYPFRIFYNWYQDYKKSKKAKITSAWFSPPNEAVGKPLTPAETTLMVT